MRTLIISAGGNGTRIKSLLTEKFNGIPKHILPLPQKSTIIEEIVTNALSFFDRVVISANDENKNFIKALIGNHEQVEIVIDSLCTGPLGPMIRELLDKRNIVYGCAGDFYCEFEWDNFNSFHKDHRSPISILVSKSLAVPEGAKFIVKDGLVTNWERISHTDDSDLINIGAYIITPDPELLTEIRTLSKHKEDNFFNTFIPNKKVFAFNPGGTGFNVNIPRVYYELCNYLRK